MKLEHFAMNVDQPLETADWYVENLNMKVVKKMDEAPFTTFLADDSGQIMIEVYNNVSASVPDYQNMHPFIVHLAFVSENPSEDSKRLQQAGAVEFTNEVREDGSHLIMMRDPWGLALQLCKRATPMLS